LDGGVAPAADCRGGGGPVPVVLLSSCPGWLVAQTAAARRSVQPASSSRAWLPWSARPGRQPRRRSPVASTMWCPPSGAVVRVLRSSRPVSDRLVSSASSVHPSGVPPSGVQPAAVRLRPSGRVHPVHLRRRWGPGRGGGHPSPQQRVESRWAAAPWSGSMGGRAGPDAGDAAEVALVSGVGGGPGQVSSGAAALDRLGDQAGQASVNSAVANGCAVGSGAGCSVRLPQRPAVLGRVGDHDGWWSWWLPPGWAGPEGPVGVPAGMGVRPRRGPGWQRALSTRCRQRRDLRGWMVGLPGLEPGTSSLSAKCQ
jgi:hypothetical protein